MLEQILIPEQALHECDINSKEIASQLESLSLNLENEVYGLALSRYLLLTYFPELMELDDEASNLRLLYNRYYWFLRFSCYYHQLHGHNAGIEQQAFQILEKANTEFDWQVIELIEKQIADGSNFRK